MAEAKYGGDYRIAVTVVQGRNLIAKDLRGSSDPFVKMTSAGKSQQTKVLKTTLAPIWKERFEFHSTARPMNIVFECLDWNRLGKDKPMGTYSVDLAPFWKDPSMSSAFQWLPLKLEGISAGTSAGEIQVQISVADIPVVKTCVLTDFTHLIEVTIVGGKDLTGDFIGKADAYCQVEWGGQFFRTVAVPNSSHPQWNQTMFLWLNENTQGGYKIAFTVKDVDYGRDQVTGFAYFPISEALGHSGYVERTLELMHKKARTDADLSRDMAAENKDCSNLGKIDVKVKLHKKADIEAEFFNGLMAEFGQLSTENEHAANTLDSAEASFMFETVGIQMTAEMFDTLDHDKNGFIDRDELMQFLSSAEAQKNADLGKILLYLRNKKDSTLNSTLMEGFTLQAESGQITVKDLETGNLVFENIPGYIKAALHVMSDTKLTRMVTSHATNLMTNLSKKQGGKYDDPISAKEIAGFVRLHNLDVREVELDISEYKTFNEFFARKLKAGARPIDTPTDHTRACSPADARMMVFQDMTVDTGKWIKGAKFTVENLLSNEGKQYVSELQGGSMVIARLAPQDYHRWHVPITGKVGTPIPIAGHLYTVNPIAINHAVNVYTENKRVLIPIQSEEFGLVMLVAVGAIMVGSIVIENDEGKVKEKGSLNGYFKFGGSTVLVLFQKNRIKFREELLTNSRANIESLIKCGSFLGTATHSKK
jgi:phosphatidylserine decarboxylase